MQFFTVVAVVVFFLVNYLSRAPCPSRMRKPARMLCRRPAHSALVAAFEAAYHENSHRRQAPTTIRDAPPRRLDTYLSTGSFQHAPRTSSRCLPVRPRPLRLCVRLIDVSHPSPLKLQTCAFWSCQYHCT
ncbi:hypothetical protein BD626DRAFT_476320 [Schizophyllum amplum]|uniref:Secreted protein n=1 Tax=Schizophyllum amplum TaxID=97359 RepID=A0A550CZ97_9AGAR|nr:hypothetical protein BD626DRAFT_476320 [Auriculariopsis ampla]